MNPILLVETDEETINDVSHSLRLVNLPIEISRSYQEARVVTGLRKPHVILSRRALNGDAQAGLEFARDAKEADATIVLLASEDDRELSADELALYREVWELPVVFPLFTKRVQDLLARLVIERRAQTKSRQVSAVAGESGAPLEASEKCESVAPLDILSEVLRDSIRRFEQDAEFQRMSRKDALERITCVVSQVCEEKKG